MLQTPLVSIAAVLIAALLGALGQYLFKHGADQHGGGTWSYLSSPWIWVGMCCYVTIMVLFSYAFRKGGTVTVLYPVYATTFIWAALIGYYRYGQPIRPVHLLGMLLLLTGMYCMGLGNASPR